MRPERTIEELASLTKCVVRVSGALFGVVYELTPDAKSFERLRQFGGSFRDEKSLDHYSKLIGENALQLVSKKQDQAVPVIAPREPEQLKYSWFAVVITQDLGVGACVAIVYPFCNQQESIRTLRLVEMIMTIKPLI